MPDIPKSWVDLATVVAAVASTLAATFTAVLAVATFKLAGVTRKLATTNGLTTGRRRRREQFAEPEEAATRSRGVRGEGNGSSG